MNSLVFLIVIPLIGAFLNLFNKKVKLISFLITLTNLIISLYLIISFSGPKIAIIGGYSPPYGINFSLTNLSALYLVLINLAAIISISLVNKEKENKFYSIYLVLLAASNGIVLTGDLFNLFIFLELSSFATAAIIAYKKDKLASGTAIKYLILASVSSSFLLIGIGLIYKTLGTLNIADIGSNIYLLSNMTLSFITILIIAGLFMEFELFPFNIWVPKAYMATNASENIMLFGLVGSSASYVMIRIIFTMLSPSGNGALVNENIIKIISIFALITILVSEISAYSENKLKKILAFSSMAQMGMIFYGLIINDMNSIKGALYLVIANFLAKIVLLILSGEFEKITGSNTYKGYKGLGRKYKSLGIAFVLASLSLMGIPFTLGFVGKINILEALFKLRGSYLIGAAIILIASIIEGIYYLKISHYLFLENKELENKDTSPRILVFVISIIFVLVIVLLGVYPKLIDNYLNNISLEILDSIKYYVKIVLP
ncbi:MAG: complex I subunit 5 family protein [Clostridiaceae bacterium]